MGLGAITAPVMAAAYGAVDVKLLPRAASAITALNRVGGSIGTAVLTLILASQHGSPADGYGRTFAWAVGLSVLMLVPAVLLPGRRSVSR
jgi:hypothetical protein